MERIICGFFDTLMSLGLLLLETNLQFMKFSVASVVRTQFLEWEKIFLSEIDVQKLV